VKNPNPPPVKTKAKIKTDEENVLNEVKKQTVKQPKAVMKKEGN
jgi:hypothetical protein